jgi:RNA polymerase sigma-70 factor (ECF subfamily)
MRIGVGEGRRGALREEAIWIAAIRSGDVSAFTSVVERYQAPIARYLRRLVGDTALAEDLAQETFVKAYLAILKTDTELALRPWLYRIATNEAKMHLRRRRLIRFLPFVAERHEAAAPPAGDDLGERDLVRRALSRLPEAYSSALLLYLVEGFKHHEVGAILGISAEAARKRVARGSELFRKIYADLEGGSRR